MKPTHLLLLAAAIVVSWGFWGFFGKLALQRAMPPLSLYLVEAAMGVAVGAAAVMVLFALGARPAWQAPVNVYGLLSGLGIAAGLLLFYLALAYGKAIVVVPLTATYPLVTVLLSYLVLGERPSAAQWLGLALVVMGAVCLLSGPLQAGEGPR